MIGRIGLAGVAALCALLFAATAPAAFAAEGTTALTCVETEKGAEFEDAHCTAEGTGAGYAQEAIPAGEQTSIALTNAGTQSGTTEPTPAVIGIRIGPMDGDIVCESVAGEGTLTNDEGATMSVSGTVTVVFSECTLVAPQTFPGCVLEKPTVTTQAEISSSAAAMRLSFTNEAEEFATFRLTKCTSSGFNTEYRIAGFYEAIPHGTTWETTAETSEGLTTAGGQASLASRMAVTRSATETGIALSTTES